MTASPFVRPSRLQQRDDGKVRCAVCERRCALAPGALGWCRTRANRQGELVTLIYGAVSSLSANPIEKKPFYHFHPGTVALTAGSWSCNFGCPWCQNWAISKVRPPFAGKYFSPEHFVHLARRRKCAGTSISFNEPTLSLEWSLDVFRLARPRGLYNTFVTNGYMTPEALSLLVEAGLDAINVDLKGPSAAVRRHCKKVDGEKIWCLCRLARSRGVHLEMTTLVIPGVNDSDRALQEIATRLATELGPDVPWHVNAYFPAYRFTAPPTPPATLSRARELGRAAGLKFVYAGNLSGNGWGDTHCPECKTVLVRRSGLSVLENNLRHGRCPRCGSVIAGVWDA